MYKDRITNGPSAEAAAATAMAAEVATLTQGRRVAASGDLEGTIDEDEDEQAARGGAAEEGECEDPEVTKLKKKKKKRGTKGKAQKTRQLTAGQDERANLKKKNRNADSIGACRGEGSGPT